MAGSWYHSESFDIGQSMLWVPIEELLEIANISLLIQFSERVMEIRDRIQGIFSGAKIITNTTTRFPEDGVYCFLNHPSLRDNFADMLIVAQNTDLRYKDSLVLREKLMKSLNELSKIVYSLCKNTRAMNGIFNRKTFESTFKLTWQTPTTTFESKCKCKDCSDCKECEVCLCAHDKENVGCNGDGCNCAPEQKLAL